MMPLWTTASPRGRVRMGVGFRRLAVRRPARMANADRSAKRRCGKFRLQVFQLALGAPSLNTAALERRNAGEIVAAVFEPLQRIDDRTGDGPAPQNSDNSTHRKKPLPQIRPGWRKP